MTALGRTLAASRSGSRGMRLMLAAAVAGLAVLLAGPSLRVTMAVFGDQATTTATLSTATLHPPTSLTSAAAATVTLNWTPTVDPTASGYYVLRSTTSGSGYAQIATVTPKTAATTTNTPAASGRYYYVLQTEFQSWTSSISNETSALYLRPAVTTATVPCVAGSYLAETGGDNNGYQTRPGSACDLGANYAQDGSTGSNGHNATCTNPANDRARFWGFALGMPGSVYQVNSITVRADALRTSNNAGTNNLCIDLSWDGGGNWSTIQSTTLTSATMTTYTIGGAVAGWGAHTWAAGDFSTANFRVRVYDATSVATQTYRLDYLAVTVNYTP